MLMEIFIVKYVLMKQTRDKALICFHHTHSPCVVLSSRSTSQYVLSIYPMVLMYYLENIAGFRGVITFARLPFEHDYTPLITPHWLTGKIDAWHVKVVFYGRWQTLICAAGCKTGHCSINVHAWGASLTGSGFIWNVNKKCCFIMVRISFLTMWTMGYHRIKIEHTFCLL